MSFRFQTCVAIVLAGWVATLVALAGGSAVAPPRGPSEVQPFNIGTTGRQVLGLSGPRTAEINARQTPPTLTHLRLSQQTGRGLFAGHAAPDARVTLLRSGSPIARARANGDGAWQIATIIPDRAGRLDFSLEQQTGDDYVAGDHVRLHIPQGYVHTVHYDGVAPASLSDRTARRFAEVRAARNDLETTSSRRITDADPAPMPTPATAAGSHNRVAERADDVLAPAWDWMRDANRSYHDNVVPRIKRRGAGDGGSDTGSTTGRTTGRPPENQPPERATRAPERARPDREGDAATPWPVGVGYVAETITAWLTAARRGYESEVVPRLKGLTPDIRIARPRDEETIAETDAERQRRLERERRIGDEATRTAEQERLDAERRRLEAEARRKSVEAEAARIAEARRRAEDEEARKLAEEKRRAVERRAEQERLAAEQQRRREAAGEDAATQAQAEAERERERRQQQARDRLAEQAEAIRRRQAESDASARAEAARREAENAERARAEAARRQAEADRLARDEAARRTAENAERARAEAARRQAEADRLARAEAARREAENAERARAEAARRQAEADRLERAEAARRAAENAERARVEATRRTEREAEERRQRLARVEAARQSIPPRPARAPDLAPARAPDRAPEVSRQRDGERFVRRDTTIEFTTRPPTTRPPTVAPLLPSPRPDRLDRTATRTPPPPPAPRPEPRPQPQTGASSGQDRTGTARYVFRDTTIELSPARSDRRTAASTQRQTRDADSAAPKDQPTPVAARSRRATRVRPRTSTARPSRCHDRAGRLITPPGTYVVARGDSLWTISRRHYRLGRLFPMIHKANTAKIRRANLIFPCQRFHLPRK